jgi:hypothetical protein
MILGVDKGIHGIDDEGEGMRGLLGLAHEVVNDGDEVAEGFAGASAAGYYEALSPGRFTNGFFLMAKQPDRLPTPTKDAGRLGM